METIIKKFCTALFASIALFACSREVGPEVPETPQGPETITITINASNDTESRTAIGENGASLWTAGDKLTVSQYFRTDIKYHNYLIHNEYVESGSAQLSSDAKVAQFSASFKNYQNKYTDATIASEHLIGVDEEHQDMKFRYQAFKGGYRSINTNERWFYGLTLPAEQHPLDDTFDPNADLLYSRPVYTENQPGVDGVPSQLDFCFRRYSALGIMTLSGVPDGISQNAIVKKVLFRSGIGDWGEEDGSVPLSGTVYQKSAVFAPENGEEIFSFNNEYTIYMDYTGKDYSPNGLNAYFTCLPANLVSGSYFTVIVIVQDGEKEKEYTRTVQLPRNLEFSSGVATTFTVDMTQAVVKKDPTLLDFVRFSDETVALFPELADPENLRIRIPRDYMHYRGRAIPIEIVESGSGWTISIVDVEDEDCFSLMDRYKEEECLELHYDPEEWWGDPFYLLKNEDYYDSDVFHNNTVLRFDNGDYRFDIPIEEYEKTVHVPSVSFFLGESEDDLVEVEPYAVEEIFVGKSVTLHAVIESEPGDLTPLACYWTNDEDYDYVEDSPIPVYSGEWTILSLEASSDQTSVVVTGIDEGWDCANFIMIVDDVWFPDWWNWVSFKVSALAPPFYGDNDAAGGDLGGGKVINL